MERAGEDIFETVDKTPQGPLSGIMKCSVCGEGVVTATRRDRAVYACPQDHARVVQADADALVVGRAVGSLVRKEGLGARRTVSELSVDEKRGLIKGLFGIELLPRETNLRSPLAVNSQVSIREF